MQPFIKERLREAQFLPLHKSENAGLSRRRFSCS
jgi:hypothetical protein